MNNDLNILSGENQDNKPASDPVLLEPSEPPAPPILLTSESKPSFSREKPPGQENATSTESRTDEWIVHDYDYGYLSDNQLPCVLDSFKHLREVPLLILYGRLDVMEVAREVVALMAQKGVRWICRLDDGSYEKNGGILRLTDPEAIRQEITAVDQYKHSKVTTRALFIAELNYSALDVNRSWQNLLLTVKREHLIQVLSECNCALIVVFNIPEHEIDPSKRLTPTLSSEVPWPDILIRKLREDGHGVRLEDDDADKMRSIINQSRSHENRALDAQFFSALRDIANLQMGVDDLKAELTRRLDKVVKDHRRQQETAEADRTDTPDRYDVRNAVHEAIVIVVLFLGAISRITFDRLVSELLPDEDVPEDLLPAHRRRISPIRSAPSITWSGPAWDSSVPVLSSKPITASSWRKSWEEDADFYREQCDIYVDGINIALRGSWIKERQSVAVFERRQTRVELIVRRIVQRGIILYKNQSVAESASKLLAALIDRLGITLDKENLIDTIGQVIDIGLQRSDEIVKNLVNPLSTLFDDISDTRGSVFSSVLYKALFDYARWNIQDRERCSIVTALCMRMRNASPRWRTGQDFSEIVRQIVSEANNEVQEVVEDVLFFEYHTLRNPSLRIDFLAPLRSWLPKKIDQQPLLPKEALALKLWMNCLNQDILWATPRTYEGRGKENTLASIAFGQDEKRRAELVRGLAGFHLENVAMLDVSNQIIFPLKNCFVDIFWMTLHGFKSTDAELIINHSIRFAIVFSAIAVTDRPIPQNIIIDISRVEQDGTLPTGIGAEIFQVNFSVKDPFDTLFDFYKSCLSISCQSTKEGRQAREIMRKLDLFNAALIAEWFFLLFGIREEALNDLEYDQVVALADTIYDIDHEKIGARLPPAFMRLARIIEYYGSVLTDIKVSRPTSRAFYLKARKLKGLSELFSNRSKKK